MAAFLALCAELVLPEATRSPMLAGFLIRGAGDVFLAIDWGALRGTAFAGGMAAAFLAVRRGAADTAVSFAISRGFAMGVFSVIQASG